jgi:dihydrofolate reductase
MRMSCVISIIAAVSDDFGIGKDNDLLWHIPEDLKRFKRLTYGKALIMGKRTCESLPLKPLPGRQNIVLTDIPGECVDCSITAYSVEDALQKCQNEDEVFIIGGGTVYKQFMPLAKRLYITHVHKKRPADVFFPEIDPGQWRVIEKEDSVSEDENRVPYSYVIYERIIPEK